MFDQDPNEQANISGADFALMVDELKSMREQRDELLAALVEYLAAGENSMNPKDGDDVAAMIRFGEAEKSARAAIAKVEAAK